MTALMLASENGHIETVQALIAANANLNMKNHIGQTALMYACAKGHTEIVEALIAADADPNIQDQYSVTPLHIAASSFKFRKSLAFIAAKADVNAADCYGSPPLHWAVEATCYEKALALIAAGADVNATDQGGRTPLELASPYNSDIAAEIIKHPLHSAIIQRHTDIALALIQAGVDVNATDHKGRTPLELSIDSCDKTTIALIRNGANTNIHYENQPILLYTMPSRDVNWPWGLRPIALDIINSRHTKVNIKDHEGRTPLHLAIQYSQTDMILALINKGADVNAPDNKGRTPLHYNRSNRAISLALIENGALVNATDNEGMTPLHYAAATRDADEDNQTLVLIEAGANVNATNNEGITPLHYAAIAREVDTIVSLIYKGADTTITNKDNKTALMIAIESDTISEDEEEQRTLEKILTRVALEYPLHAASIGFKANVIHALIERGYDMNSKIPSIIQTDIMLSLIHI